VGASILELDTTQITGTGICIDPYPTARGLVGIEIASFLP